MKNLKLTIVIVAGLIINLANSFASGSEAVLKSNPEIQLRTEIAGLFTGFSFESVDIQGKECELWLTFKVDENNEITSVRYQCDNEAVTSYVKKVIENTEISVPENTIQKYYKVPITFVAK